MARSQPKVRVYVPATVAELAGLLSSSSLSTAGRGFAVTPAVRDVVPDGDDDEWEFAAYSDAATACLAILDPAAGALRRVVVALDLVPEDVSPPDSAAPVPSAVHVPMHVPRAAVVSVHVDDAQAAEVISRVLSGAPGRLLDDVALEWYAASEVEALVAQLVRT